MTDLVYQLHAPYLYARIVFWPAANALSSPLLQRLQADECCFLRFSMRPCNKWHTSGLFVGLLAQSQIAIVIIIEV